MYCKIQNFYNCSQVNPSWAWWTFKDLSKLQFLKNVCTKMACRSNINFSLFGYRLLSFSLRRPLRFMRLFLTGWAVFLSQAKQNRPRKTKLDLLKGKDSSTFGHLPSKLIPLGRMPTTHSHRSRARQMPCLPPPSTSFTFIGYFTFFTSGIHKDFNYYISNSKGCVF
jgi:hypothetical protein